MSPLYMKLYFAKTIGKIFGNSLVKSSIYLEPLYTIGKDHITIYNFTHVDEHGYLDKTDFIQLVPTNEPYNLLDKKSRKIFLDKNCLETKEKREFIINAIRQALVETNEASEMDNVYILKDLSILVSSDDWSNNHELL